MSSFSGIVSGITRYIFPFSLFTMKWSGRNDFCLAQVKVAVIIGIAYFVNNWEPRYPRNDNHNPTMFWICNAILAIGAMSTWTHKESTRGVVLLSRAQTEEWKGWMQWAFIMYHYYRVFSVYNEIRVFVSCYVWMTGFGNFLYFDKKGDYSLERIVSMIIRINYFPVLLSLCLGVPLDLYYVVPLHTVGFVMTMATCYLGVTLEKRLSMTYWQSRLTALAISGLAHVLFYETSMVDSLLFFSKEIHFRFQADKYSAWQGIIGGLLMGKSSEYLKWAYGGEHEKTLAKWCQRALGLGLIFLWYFTYGHIADKFTYNPVHPYIFFLPLLGWLMLRNSSKYLTECHCGLLEVMGRNTLETYVLQFHVFMCDDVQKIPIIIPGAGADGTALLRFLNMLVCGVPFFGLAVYARLSTVTTQTTVVELVRELRNPSPPVDPEEESALVDKMGNGDLELASTNDKCA